MPNLTCIKFTGYMVFTSSVCIATNKFSVCVLNIDLGVYYSSSHADRQGSHSPGHPTVQFLIAYSMQASKSKGGRPGSIYYMNDVSVHVDRRKGGGGGKGGRSSNDRTILRSFLAASIRFVMESQKFVKRKKLLLIERMKNMLFYSVPPPPPSLPLSPLPPSVYLSRHWCHSSDHKTGGKGLGTRQEKAAGYLKGFSGCG